MHIDIYLNNGVTHVAHDCPTSTHRLFYRVFLLRETGERPFARRYRPMARYDESRRNLRRSKRDYPNRHHEGVLCVWPTRQRGVVCGPAFPKSGGRKHVAVSLERASSGGVFSPSSKQGRDDKTHDARMDGIKSRESRNYLFRPDTENNTRYSVGMDPEPGLA